MADAPQYYPLDFDTLEKGDVIPADRIALVSGAEPGTAEYRWAMLSLRDRIHREMRGRGQAVTVKCEGDQLRVLTDNEAAEYNAKHFRRHQHGMFRAFIRNSLVDKAQLTEVEQAGHERNLLMQSRLLQAHQREQRKLAEKFEQPKEIE